MANRRERGEGSWERGGPMFSSSETNDSPQKKKGQVCWGGWFKGVGERFQLVAEPMGEKISHEKGGIVKGWKKGGKGWLPVGKKKKGRETSRIEKGN